MGTFLLIGSGSAWSQSPPATYELTIPTDADAASGSSLTTLSCGSDSFCLESGRYENAALYGEEEFSTSDGTSSTGETGVQVSGASVTPDNALDGSSCPVVSTCIEVGYGVYEGSPPAGWTQPLVESWSNGTATVLGAPSLPNGLSVSYSLRDTMNAVSCSSASQCVAGGSYEQSLFIDQMAFVQVYSGGLWGSPLALTMPGATSTNHTVGNVLSISCWSAGNCEAAGSYHAATGVTLPFVDPIVDGVPQGATELPLPAGTQSSYYFFGPEGISCPSAGYCVAVGGWAYDDAPYAQYPIAWTLSGGTWSVQSLALPATPPSGNPFGGVSCASAGRCLAVASSSTTGVPTAGEAYELTDGAWQAPTPISVPANFSTTLNDEQLFFEGVSCVSSGRCVFGGSYNDTSDVPQSLVGSLTLPPSATAPSAPSIMSVTPSNANVAVGFNAPASNGGSPVTSYDILQSTSKNGTFSLSATSPSTCTTSPCVVTGLTNGTTYYFEVEAVNEDGPGAASLPSSGTMPYTTPSAPSSVSVTPGSGDLKVTWQPPKGSGGSPVSGYVSTATAGKRSFKCKTVTKTCTISMLATDTAYKVAVTASNAAGAGPAADLSFDVFAVTSTRLAVDVLPIVVKTRHDFTVLAYGAPPGKIVRLEVPGSSYKCTTDAAGQCWSTASVTKSGRWHAVATVGTLSASAKFYAPLIRVPLQVRRGHTLVATFFSAPPGCSITETIDGTAETATASTSGTATIRVTLTKLGLTSVVVNIDGTAFNPHSVDVT